MSEHDATPGISKNEYARRRHEFMRRLVKKSSDQPNHLVILQAPPVTFSAPDVPHPFRQDSNFLYLTGFREPDSVLVLHNIGDGDSCRSTLFVAPRNEYKELWEGPRAGVDGASALTGVDSVLEKHELYDYLQTYAKRRFVFWRDSSKRLSPVSIPSKSIPVIGGQERQQKLSMDIDHLLSQSTLNGGASNPIPILHDLRWIKSEAEIDLLRRAGRIGAESMIETMRFSKPGIVENVLGAKMDLECRLRGADHLAYPPVIAGGARANIIHYLNNDQRITKDENLVLMDAGCDVSGYVSDITRTWPVTGRFTDPQRILYEIVHQVQLELLNYVATVRPIGLKDVFLTMLELLAFGIREAGILKNPSKNEDDDEAEIRQADRFCPHHVSHYLGMDVHDVDTVSKQIDLKPGVVITVEPGIYIKPNDQSVKEEFRGYGIRIEDDVLITETGAEVLTDAVPKSPSDLESIVRSG